MAIYIIIIRISLLWEFVVYVYLYHRGIIRVLYILLPLRDDSAVRCYT